MSLLRHLLLGVTTALALLLIVSQALSIDKARKYFGWQLRTQSEAGAAMLASAFSRDHRPSEENWHALANKVFEHGDYASLRVEGPFLLEYHKPPTAKVLPPRWFMTLVSLESEAVTHAFQAMSGAPGAVTVMADVTKAARTLWQYCIHLVGLITVGGLLWLLSVNTQIRWLQKRLLHEISQQVRALARGEANPKALPTWREVAEVTHALAEAREQFRLTAQETHARIEGLQRELNLDTVTRLPNRKYFFNALRQALNTPSHDNAPAAPGIIGGHIVMFRQRDLAAINRYMPRDFTDQWLRNVALRLEQKLGHPPASSFLLARLNGSDFALLLPNIPRIQAVALAETLRGALGTLRVSLGDHTWCRWALAITHYQPGDHASELLASLDHALMRAESADTDVIFQAERPTLGEAPGEYQWRDTLTVALAQHRFSLATHAVENATDTLLHYEGALMLHDTQPLYPATPASPLRAEKFMPAAIRLGLVSECDIQAVRLALDWLVSHPHKLAIPLTLSSLEQPNFLPRLGQMLYDRPAQATRLVLEVHAQGMIEHFAQIQNLCEVARKAGSHIGICQLAQDFKAMTKLHWLPIIYVKLGTVFVSSIAQSPGSRHLTRCVRETARTLNIDVYAEEANDDAHTFLDEIGIMVIHPRRVRSPCLEEVCTHAS